MDRKGKENMGKRILIAAPVRQKTEIFKEYLNSLNHLIIPEEYEADKFFYLHNCPELSEFLQENEYQIVYGDSEIIKENNKQKQWTYKNFYALYQMRTALLRKASQEKYDYLFTVDSDILLHPKTLITLLNDDKDIVGNMIWTKMENNNIGAICGKNEEWGAYENLEQFKIPGIYPVGWTCACLLISSRIFNNSNVSYWPIRGIDNTGCEDYAFCMRAKCNFYDLQVWIDTKLPARHLYHEKDFERWIKEKKQYE